MPFWRPAKREPTTAHEILTLLAPIGDHGPRTALECAAGPSVGGVPFLIITSTTSHGGCQEVTVCGTEQEARHHADSVVRVFRECIKESERRQNWAAAMDTELGLAWLRAVGLDAEPLCGTEQLHWIEAVMLMSKKMFFCHGHEISGDMQIFVWNSVICNGQPLQLETLAHHHKSGYSSRCAAHSLAISLADWSFRDVAEEQNECYDYEQDMVETRDAEEERRREKYKKDWGEGEDEDEDDGVSEEEQ